MISHFNKVSHHSLATSFILFITLVEMWLNTKQPKVLCFYFGESDDWWCSVLWPTEIKVRIEVWQNITCSNCHMSVVSTSYCGCEGCDLISWTFLWNTLRAAIIFGMPPLSSINDLLEYTWIIFSYGTKLQLYLIFIHFSANLAHNYHIWAFYVNL